MILIVDGGESAKNLMRPGMERLLALVNERKVDTVIIAKLDRLTRSVKDLCGLLELFEKRNVARGWRTRRHSAWRLEHVARIVGNRKAVS